MPDVPAPAGVPLEAATPLICVWPYFARVTSRVPRTVPSPLSSVTVTTVEAVAFAESRKRFVR